MDLDVFGQSLIESSTAQLDEASVLPLSPGPLSPLASQPPTPIQPASPQDLYSSPVSQKIINQIPKDRQLIHLCCYSRRTFIQTNRARRLLKYLLRMKSC